MATITDIKKAAEGDTNERMLRNAAGRLVGHDDAAHLSVHEMAALIAEAGWDWGTVLQINS